MKQPRQHLIIIICLFFAVCMILLLNSAFLKNDTAPENELLATYINEDIFPKNIDEDFGGRTVYPTITMFPTGVATKTPTSFSKKILSTDIELLKVTLTSSPQPLPEKFYDESRNPFIIGYSVEGRPLEIYKFGNGESIRLIIAGIHGGYEYNTTDLALAMIQEINKMPDLIPENVTVYILPSLNPDGLARSHGYLGRANANNVDLNRNWELYWSETWNPDGCWQYLPISGGTSALSEPEVIALDQFIERRHPDAVISYHSAALGIFSGGFPTLTISNSLAESIASVAPYPYPPIQTNCEMTGQFIDSLAYRGIPAVDIELSNHKDIELNENLLILQEFLNWNPKQP